MASDQSNNRVQKYNSSGIYVSQFGLQGSENGQLISPWDLVVDSMGNTFVTDSLNNRVQKFNTNGIFQIE